MQGLPLGYQDFKKIREENKLYVDKTEYIWNIINGGEVYFLSRPRRFGKSLLISTLEYLFKGEKHLFEGLAISKKDYNWQQYPVITLRMNAQTTDSLDLMQQSICYDLHSIAKCYDIKLIQSDDPPILLKDLIEKCHEFGPVVVLIDEYDKPLLDMLGLPIKTPEQQEIRKQRSYEVRNFLKSFYGKLKSADSMLKFVFITGVSKFTKTSIFSDLNHLNDITMDTQYGELLGYTQAELELYFTEYIQELHLKYPQIKDIKITIKRKYNGYLFAEENNTVYNPFSILALFLKKKFHHYWFETGTPTFLINLIREKGFPKEILTGKKMNREAFATWDIENLNLWALMFQTGYLTIKATEPAPYDPLTLLYELNLPNEEVTSALMMHILASLSGHDYADNSPVISDLSLALYENDMDAFFKIIKSLFANIGYELHISDEHYYQSLFFITLTIIGQRPRAEEQTNIGRMDLVTETANRIYLFEFKLDKTAKEAMDQIHEKKYYEKFLYLQKPISLVGVAIDSKKREVQEWLVEEKRN